MPHFRSDEPLDAIVVEGADTATHPADALPGATTRAAKSGGTTWRQWIDDPWILLGTLFFVTAALGLPLLWMSRAFSLRGKIFWTVAVTAWTVLILALFGLLMWWCYRQIQQALSVAYIPP